MVAADRPSMVELWMQAKGDPHRYRALMREHGLLLVPGDEGYEDGVPVTEVCRYKRGDADDG